MDTDHGAVGELLMGALEEIMSDSVVVGIAAQVANSNCYFNLEFVLEIMNI